MDGRGRWRDNVFVERLWRSVKYEEVYLRAYNSVARRATRSALIWRSTILHHNTHLSMRLTGIGFSDRGAILRQL